MFVEKILSSNVSYFIAFIFLFGPILKLFGPQISGRTLKCWCGMSGWKLEIFYRPYINFLGIWKDPEKRTSAPPPSLRPYPLVKPSKYNPLPSGKLEKWTGGQKLFRNSLRFGASLLVASYLGFRCSLHVQSTNTFATLNR